MFLVETQNRDHPHFPQLLGEETLKRHLEEAMQNNRKDHIHHLAAPKEQALSTAEVAVLLSVYRLSDGRLEEVEKVEAEGHREVDL